MLTEIIIIWFWFSTIVSVFDIGKPRKPVTHGTIALMIVMTLLFTLEYLMGW